MACWDLVREHAVDVFEPGCAAVLSQLSGWSALGLPRDGIDREATVTLLDLLRAFALRERARGRASTSAVELVATLPRADRSVLSTVDVVRTLVEGARKSLLIIGFDIRDPPFRRMLFRRGLDGIDVTVVGDRETGAARELLRDWPAASRPLKALENVEPASGNPSRLHGKVIIADATTALVGSANFTAGGLRNNIEFGFRATGTAVLEIQRTVERLEREGWLVGARA